MEQHQITEWSQLQDRALQIMRGNGNKDGVRLLQILIMPSFEAATSYEIREAKSAQRTAKCLGVITCWRQDIDVAKFVTPVERLKYPLSIVPTLECQSFEMTSEDADQILDGFRNISVPVLIGTREIGLDGTIYEVELEDGLLQSHFRWWNRAPKEWQRLENVFQATLAKFNEFVSSQR